MKILQIIPTISSGGGERFTVDLCNELAKRGHEVTLCVLFPLEGTYAFYVDDVLQSVRLVSLNKKVGIDIGCIIKTYRFIKSYKPDVVHTHLRAITYVILSIFKKIKFFHTVHNEAHIEAETFIDKVLRNILFKSKLVTPVTISPESRLSFRGFYKMDAPIISNGRNVPSNLDVSKGVKEEIKRYKKNDSTKVIVHLAHLDEVKRQDLLARVARRLYDEGYNFSILFIGAIRIKEYEEKVRSLMPPCAYILGERKNPLEYLKEAGAYALCSKYEGLPISLIEALGVGAIPICMPLGGIPNLVTSGENGLLSVDLEEESYYVLMKKYLDMSDNETRDMRNRAIVSYRPYSMTECAEKYESLYYKILNQKVI